MTATAGGLGARLARLEQIVSGLQAQAGGGESLSPNYLTLGPDGQIGADFTGLINALGLILPAGTLPQNPQLATDQVVWEDTGNGTMVASVQAFANDPSSDSGIQVLSQATSSAWLNSVNLEALSDPADPAHTKSAIQITQRNRGAIGGPGAIGGFTEVDAFVGSKAAMILDAGGRSSFLQVASPPQQLDIDLGSAAMPFSGGGSASVSVFHALGRPPVFFAATFVFGGAIGLWGPYAASADASQVTWHSVATAAVASTAFTWAVIG